jgi:hypothetical protein
MKISTPMKVLKDHLRNFSELTKDLEFHRKDLDKKSAKYVPYVFSKKDSKPVNSDFIKIFSFDKEALNSFAFKFTFLDSEGKNIIEEQFFEITFLIDNEFYSSKVYSIVEAKLVLKKINQYLKLENPNRDELFTFLINNFKVDNHATIEEFCKQFYQNSSELMVEYEDEIKNFEMLNIRSIKKEAEFNFFVNNIEESKEIILLQQKINDLRKVAQLKRQNKKDELNIELLKEAKIYSHNNVQKIFDKIRIFALKINKNTKVRIDDIDDFLKDFIH